MLFVHYSLILCQTTDTTMKKTITIAFLLASALTARAQYVESCPECQPKIDFKPSKTVLLYPEGQAAGKGIVENGVQITNGPKEDNGLRGPETCSASGSRKNVGDDARMDFYFPEKPNGLMVIMTPGGGYQHLSTFNEGVYGSKWLTDRGVTVAVLKYRLPNHHHTIPLDDVQNAFRYCRYHAAEWGVNKIGVMGGSAGGHLASSASTMWVDEITRPDFAVLIYPRITLRRGENCDTKDWLLNTDESWNDNVDEHMRLCAYYSPDTHVSPETPPTYIVLSADDKSVPATNHLPYYTRLVECKVPVEVHVYPSGGHGWGFSDESIKGPGKDKFARWRPDFEATLEAWLMRML